MIASSPSGTHPFTAAPIVATMTGSAAATPVTSTSQLRRSMPRQGIPGGGRRAPHADTAPLSGRSPVVRSALALEGAAVPRPPLLALAASLALAVVLVAPAPAAGPGGWDHLGAGATPG